MPPPLGWRSPRRPLPWQAACTGSGTVPDKAGGDEPPITLRLGSADASDNPTAPQPVCIPVDPNQMHAIPGLTAETPHYREIGGMPSERIHAAIVTCFHRLTFPPGIRTPSGDADTTMLGNVLDGLHRPTSEDQRAWAMAHAGWALEMLNHIRAARPAMPTPRLIKTPTDAEAYACDVMLALGFAGATCTNAGRDGGVDVRSRDAVAQVKVEGIKTDAPRLQALSGVAAHERKRAVFFSLSGYTAAALAWAERTGMALFEFDYAGGVEARSTAGHALLARGATP
jgi:hypothetical protein